MARRLRVLIADDHPIVRSGLRRLLADAPDVGDVGEAADPQEVLDLARAGEWDVIVLDIGLPGRGGLEVLRAIRSDERTRTMPVVVLTSSHEERDVVESYKLGVNSYVVKPVDFENFSAAVAATGHYWLIVNQATP